MMVKSTTLSFFRVIPFLYLIGVVCMLIPLFSLLIFVFHAVTGQLEALTYWLFFLVGLLPCGVLALVLNSVGFYLTRRERNRFNNFLGKVLVYASVGEIAGGLVGLLLVYLVIQ